MPKNDLRLGSPRADFYGDGLLILPRTSQLNGGLEAVQNWQSANLVRAGSF
jgi:hypothetical protein